MNWLSTHDYIPPLGVWCLVTIRDDSRFDKLMLKFRKNDGCTYWYDVDEDDEENDVWCDYKDVSHFIVITPPPYSIKLIR